MDELIAHQLSSLGTEKLRVRTYSKQFYQRLKTLKRMIIRYEGTVVTYEASISIACIIIQLKIRNLEMGSLLSIFSFLIE